MADNILTKDRDAADIAIAAKDVGGIKVPRNILTDPTGADLTPLTDAALRATPVQVLEATPTTVTIVSLQTNVVGTTYNAFASQACEMLDIVNTALNAVDLEVRRGGSGATIIVPAGSSRMFIGLSNASGLQVRRRDTSNAQVTFTAEAVKS